MNLTGEDYDAAQGQHRQGFRNLDISQVFFGLEPLFPFGLISHRCECTRLWAAGKLPALPPPLSFNVVYGLGTDKPAFLLKEVNHGLLRAPHRKGLLWLSIALKSYSALKRLTS